MSEVTRILSAIEQGDPHAAEQLLPLVYEELRQLAAQKLAQEKLGQTLQPTALVHEAYILCSGSVSVQRRCVPTAKKDTHRPGLAPALGSGVRWFESSRPDINACRENNF